MKRHYFVTGATGVIGSALISCLLESTENQIWVLMRSNDANHLVQRFNKLISFLGLNEQENKDAIVRIKPVKGDMDEPKFGMTTELYDEIAAECSHIIHCAGMVRMNLPLSEARKHAVGSVKSVTGLALACKANGQLKKVDIVSTVGVIGNLPGTLPETWITEKRTFHNSYEESKAEAEDYLRMEIQHHDLPVTIHRPSMVVGDSRTGQIIHFQIFYHVCEFLSGRRTYGLSSTYGDFVLDTVPSDYVAQVIKWSSENVNTTGKIFHLTSGPKATIKLTELRRIIRKMMQSRGIKLPRIFSLPRNIFLVIIKLITPLLHEKSQRAVKTLPILLDYLSEQQLFANELTRNFLEAHQGPKLPFVEEYMEKVLEYYFDSID